MKLLRATEQAYESENQKRRILQAYVDDYETNVYRVIYSIKFLFIRIIDLLCFFEARKPCCISTSYRLSKLATQLRLCIIIELALHELFHSSCSCGQFKRSYQTYMRLHKK